MFMQQERAGEVEEATAPVEMVAGAAGDMPPTLRGLVARRYIGNGNRMMGWLVMYTMLHQHLWT